MLLPLLLSGSMLVVEDWPRFGGPKADNTSAETGLRRAFPEAGPSVLWTAKVEEGYAGVAVRDGQVHLMDRVVGEKDVLRVLDLESGEELWRFEHEVPGRVMFPGARSVPCVEEDLVYAQGAFGKVYCIDRETHEAEWIVDVAEDHGGEMPMFGYSCSPLVHEDLLLLAPLGADTGLLALDRFIGEPMWETPGIGSSHSSPCLVELLGQPMVLMLSSVIDPSIFSQPPPDAGSAPPPGTFGQGPPQDSVVPEEMADFEVPGQGLLVAYDLEGEELWRSDLYYCSTAIPQPLRIDDQRLFLTGGYGAGSMMIRLTEGDEGIRAEKVFAMEKGAQIHLPLQHEEHLYLLVNENKNDPRRRRPQGGLMCLDLEGNEKWRTGNDPYFGRGAMILADGMLIVQDGLNGTLRLIEPTPEEYRVLAEANVFGIDDRKDHQMWAPMALAGGRLLMRSQTELKCLDLRAGSGD